MLISEIKSNPVFFQSTTQGVMEPEPRWLSLVNGSSKAETTKKI